MIDLERSYGSILSFFADVRIGSKFGELKPLSYSQIDTYLTCPQKYYFSYINNAAEEGYSKRNGSGLAFYGILTRTLKESYGSGRLASLEKILDIYRKFWVSSNFADAAEETRYLEEGRKILTEFYEKNKDEKGEVAKVAGGKNREEKFPALDRKVRLDMGGVGVSEKIDRIMVLPDGSFESVVYRLGRPFGQDLRPALLMLAARKLFPFRRHRVSYYFLRENRKAVCESAGASAKKLRDKSKDAARGIIKGEFSPSKGPSCCFCNFRASCAAWGGVRYDRTRMRLSYSKLNSFLTCPRQYRFAYVDRVAPKLHSFFSLGTSVHGSLEKFYSYDGILKKPGLSTLLAMLKENWRSEGYAEDGAVEKEYYKRARMMLGNYYRSFVSGAPYRRAYKTEEYFEIPIGGKALMTGFIDRIDKLPGGGYEISDYKTEPKWPGDRIMEDHKLQLALYWWACREGKITPEPPSLLSLYMLQFDKKISFRPRAAGEAGDDGTLDMDGMLGEIIARIDRAVDEIKSAEQAYRCGSSPDEVFVPKRNDYCLNCDFKLDCPLFLI